MPSDVVADRSVLLGGRELGEVVVPATHGEERVGRAQAHHLVRLGDVLAVYERVDEPTLDVTVHEIDYVRETTRVEVRLGMPGEESPDAAVAVADQSATRNTYDSQTSHLH